MPSILTKLLMPEWSLPYNCYEIGHTWTPSCDDAALDMTEVVFRESIKLYIPLYVFNAVMRRKFNYKALTSVAINTLRSSSFLTFTAFLMMKIFCGLRLYTGRFYYTLCAYLPVFIGSLCAIQIEKKSRRGAIAVYCANIASETVYKMLVTRHHIKPIPRGEVLLFTVSISVLLYLVRSHGYGKDPISAALKVTLGAEESANYLKRRSNQQKINDKNVLKDEKLKSNKQFISELKLKFKHFIALIDNYFRRHPNCSHSQNSCVLNSVYYFVRNFTIGWSAQVLMSTVMKPKKLLNSPKTQLISQMSDKNNLYFGLFLGTFSAIYKTINCLLKWTTNSSQEWHSFVAAFCAGPAMLLSTHSTNSTLSLYLFWKCIETLYLMAVKKGWIGCMDQTVMLLYAISTAQIAYVCILEPMAMRPSYLKFVNRITGGKVTTFNRFVLDVFGTGASKGYENMKFPKLNLNHTTRQYKENILSWIL